jgi:predicted branched-subunit amino acid permease
MLLSRAMVRHPEFMAGVRAMGPQVPGMAALGLMTGVAMVKSGLSLTEALAMALLVYAGSAQLAALPLLVAGAPVWVILAAGFCVNLRYVVFSLHLRDYLIHLPRAPRLLAGYLSTDMGYVLLTHRHPQPAADAVGREAQTAHLMGLNACNWVVWMVPSGTGVLLSNFIPTEWGLGFAGLLCLIGIVGSLATTPLRLVAAGIAGATAIAAYALPLKLNIVLAIGVAVLACVALEARPRWRPARP